MQLVRTQLSFYVPHYDGRCSLITRFGFDLEASWVQCCMVLPLFVALYVFLYSGVRHRFNKA